MVDIASFPSLIRSMTWGAATSEDEKYLREPLLMPEDDDNDSLGDDDDSQRVYDVHERLLKKKLDAHVVIKVEPKLTRSERLLRLGRSSAMGLFASIASRPSATTYMNLSPKIESNQEIMVAALIKLAVLTILAVAWLLTALYRQAALAA
ncbi:hypothetical protein SPRG_03039 [Saprolegnia parasitica CBS 223.65]|uniref:Uncharacterized protein n=1 Tax=Saprolegnia parasitica (strain CBS 223.65) TaxID=695850 RepID=A0A067CPD6_SAPPC|nr:hypothetical protein SPRG_03039 [Saprolegnia parasitica CBS 223.65]KDO32564.1 hypothetical protein SPRG_03039 [Saprolegnia parasitica CBS 223.65]|eukprot:XP_012197010.1 hypothetical protein SPRG_03039 [Saprolegnia parasitica CBS 223.65]